MKQTTELLKERCVFTVTFDEIYTRMKNDYIQRSGIGFDEASDIALRLKVLAGEVFNLYSNFEWLKRQMFAATASGEYLDYIAAQRGLTRRAATKASGTITFYVDEFSTDPILIPQGTVAATSGENPLRIYTVEDAVIPINTGSVTVRAEVETAGFNGNIRNQTVLLPISVPQEISRITNTSSFTGGADTESDASLRERIKDSYYCVPNCVNKAYYQQLAKSVDGVDKAGVVTFARGIGTMNLYVSSFDGDVSQQTLDKVTEVINREREINLDIRVIDATSIDYDMTVTVKAKAGYTEEEVTELCTQAFEDYISTIPIGGKLYLSNLGRHLLETGCIENYEFDVSMTNAEVPGSQYFVSGDVTVEVI